MTDNKGNIDPTLRQASREASGWMIRLQDAPDDVELQRQFNEWLADPVNTAAWEETQRMSRAVAAATPSHAESWGPFLRQARAETKNRAAATEQPRQVPPNDGNGADDATRNRAPSGRISHRRTLRFAGLAAVVALLAVVSAPELTLRLQADYTTATVETRTVRLADDSVVTVAPASAIAVSYTVGERHLRLLAGEFYLEVRPDAERPFRVSSDDVRVKVLGTGFNVLRGDDGIEVGVAHGTVRVHRDGTDPSAAATLGAGEFVRVHRSGRIQRGKQPASQIGAWRQNQLIAQDQPLQDVIDRLRRYHAGAIVVMNDSLADQPVTGVYDLGNPVLALRGIARSQNAVVHEITPWLLVLSGP